MTENRDRWATEIENLADDIIAEGDDEAAAIVNQLESLVRFVREGAHRVGAWTFVNGAAVHYPSFKLGREVESAERDA